MKAKAEGLPVWVSHESWVIVSVEQKAGRVVMGLSDSTTRPTNVFLSPAVARDLAASLARHADEAEALKGGGA